MGISSISRNYTINASALKRMLSSTELTPAERKAGYLVKIHLLILTTCYLYSFAKRNNFPIDTTTTLKLERNFFEASTSADLTCVFHSLTLTQTCPSISNLQPIFAFIEGRCVQSQQEIKQLLALAIIKMPVLSLTKNDKITVVAMLVILSSI